MTDLSAIDIPAPLRLHLVGDALVSNWRTLARMSGAAACGAAVKADGYGLGAVEVAARLARAGCRDFFVASWREAAALAHLDLPLAVLHGVRDEDMAAALSGIARPVLNTAAQVARWKAAGGGACDIMIDTGMNRLGLGAGDLALLDGLRIDTLMSHLACADDDSAMNEQQRHVFAGIATQVDADRLSLANSAGIGLGKAYAFDLTRPGIALYGGSPRRALEREIRQVAFPQAQVLQCRCVEPGDTVGYNATWTAKAPCTIAIVNLGYADGVPRSLSNVGAALFEGAALRIVGRVSMDLTALLVPKGTALREGDWVTFEYDLEQQAGVSGRSAYELLVALGGRLDRRWS